MVAGVSDLIYFNGEFNAIEVKVSGSKHSINHIQSQYDWGCKIVEKGGTYNIVTSVYGFWSIINGFYDSKDVLSLRQINILLNEGKKTIVF